MDVGILAHRTLLVVQATTAATAVAGGIALVVGASNPGLSMVITPPPEYLAGSPFSTYLVPGIVLAVVVGGLHALGFATLLKRAEAALLLSAVAAFAMLIWIFMQMVYIPFSFLQAVYFLAGLAEIGLIMVLLGLLPLARRTTAVGAGGVEE